MDNELDFEKLMIYPITCLKCVHLHPEIPHNLRWLLRFVFMHSIYTLYVFLLVHGVLAIEDIKGNIIDVCSLASFVVLYFVISFKVFVLIKYRATFESTIDDVKKSYNEANILLPEEERQVVLKYALEGRRITKFWVVVLLVGFFVFFTVPLIMMVYYYVSGRFRFVAIVEMDLPDLLEKGNPNAVFWFTFALWEYFTFYTCAIYVGIVPLGPVFMLFACGQLELMKGRMLKLFPADGNVTCEQRAKNLKDMAMQLQAIYDFVDKLKFSLKLLYELTLKGTSLITPIIAYVMLESAAQGQVRPEFAVLLFGALMICSLPCYYGNRLIEKSSELQEAVYFSGWEGFYDRKTRSTLLILMTRMQSTVAIRSIFVTVCLEALSDVLKQAYALFNFLHTAWGQ